MRNQTIRAIFSLPPPGRRDFGPLSTVMPAGTVCRSFSYDDGNQCQRISSAVAKICSAHASGAGHGAGSRREQIACARHHERRLPPDHQHASQGFQPAQGAPSLSGQQVASGCGISGYRGVSRRWSLPGTCWPAPWRHRGSRESLQKRIPGCEGSIPHNTGCCCPICPSVKVCVAESELFRLECKRGA